MPLYSIYKEDNMIFLFTYISSNIIAGCLFLSWYIFKTKNDKENKKLR